jgi:hypothetical protein
MPLLSFGGNGQPAFSRRFFWLVAVGAAYLEKRNAIPAKWGTDLPPGQALADEYAAVCL